MKTEHTIVITINDNRNYGNRLQNYALLHVLHSNGLNPSTAKILLNINTPFSFANHLILLYVKKIVIYILSRIPLSKKWLKLRRLLEGIRYTKLFAPDNIYLLTAYAGLNIRTSISNIVIGSDQVWNYRWLSKEDLALRLGSFVPDDIPIVSYAASFGVSEISDDVKPIFQRYLPRLKAISVREDRGAELVKEMTGLDATVVLDPTLMLTTAQWNTITRGFVPDDDRYVLTYFLGKPSDEQEKTIQSYAKTHGCRVRRILDLRDKETYVAGPQDFVELFSKAQYVFTDSYHACCFSILFHKQFTVFNRAGMEGKANMNSRMETLFRLFDLDSVVMDKGLAPRIDYDKVDKLLAQHRTESQAWLDKAMEV